MEQSEFDRYAEDYAALHAASVAISGESPEYFADYKIREIAQAMGRLADSGSTAAQAAALEICDFGAGIGGSVPFVHKYFPESRLTCIDVSRRSLEFAEKRFAGLARYIHYEGDALPLAADQFDIVYAVCVFHHIDAERHAGLLAELKRLLRPGGRLFLFEHNPWNPLTVRIVASCPFDENAHLVSAPVMKRRLVEAGFRAPATHYRLFFPRILRALRPFERALSWLPLGGQYFLSARK